MLGLRHRELVLVSSSVYVLPIVICQAHVGAKCIPMSRWYDSVIDSPGQILSLKVESIDPKTGPAEFGISQSRQSDDVDLVWRPSPIELSAPQVQ